MADQRGTEQTPKAPALEGVVDDVLGFDFKLPRTLRDLIFRPGRIADAALANDHSRYSRPLKVLLAVYALQFVVGGWSGYLDTGTFGVIYADSPAALATVEARLAAAGSSLAEADELIRQWTSWASWPLVAISSLLYMLVIWATRPSLGLGKSALLYVVLSAAGNAVIVPATLIGGLFGGEGLIWSAAFGFVVLWTYAGLVLHKRAADTALGLAMRLLAFALTTIPVVIGQVALVFGVVEAAFGAETGLSRIGLIIEAGPGSG